MRSSYRISLCAVVMALMALGTVGSLTRAAPVENAIGESILIHQAIATIPSVFYGPDRWGVTAELGPGGPPFHRRPKRCAA